MSTVLALVRPTSLPMRSLESGKVTKHDDDFLKHKELRGETEVLADFLRD
jgi:hypothetical protein